MGYRTNSISRRVVLAALLAPLPALADPVGARVLFVCRYGTVKSPIARAQMERRAAQRRVAVEVRARCLTPQDHMTPKLAAALRADRIDLPAGPVPLLRETDLAWSEVLVAFDPPSSDARLAGARDWSDLPPMTVDYAASRRVLLQRVDRLLDELGRERRGH